MEPGTGEAFLVQQLADLLVVAAVDGDDFELVVSLAEQQRQVVLDEIIAVLADYDDDGNGGDGICGRMPRLLRKRGRPPYRPSQ